MIAKKRIFPSVVKNWGKLVYSILNTLRDFWEWLIMEGGIYRRTQNLN